jgi:hypothetical protein
MPSTRRWTRASQFAGGRSFPGLSLDDRILDRPRRPAEALALARLIADQGEPELR